jgi:hypothetical protein
MPGPPAVGLRQGYACKNRKYDAAVFLRNCTNNSAPIYGINFVNFTGGVNESQFIGTRFTGKRDRSQETAGAV